MRSPWRSVAQFVRDDSMSILLFTLFAVCLAGQGVAGWLAYRETLVDLHRPAIGLGAYLQTGDFLDGIVVNWQAAILQLAVLIAFGSVLRQRGAAHSKREEGDHPSATHPRTLEWKFSRRDSFADWLHGNSLSVAFFAMFALTSVAHVFTGHLRHDEMQALLGLKPQPLGAYLASADFVNSLMQTWEAEFVAAGAYIVLSIFLRQDSSPESKPVDAPNSQTGEAKG